jgi:hypothetical protein
MMAPQDGRRVREIETPFGPVEISETRWNVSEDDEHWAYNQDFQFDFDKDTPNGEIVGEMLKQYAVARQLTSDGYEFHSMLEDGVIFWINYTSTSNDNQTNQN